MAFWNRFFGSAGSQAAGIAVGATAIPALRPAVQYLENEAWAAHPDRPPDAFILAEGVAQGHVDEQSARDWAHQQGFSDAVFTALVDIANVGPDLGRAYQAWRRGDLGPGDFDTAMHRLGIEERWWAALRALKDERLDLGAIATAVHRGIMQSAGLLVTEPPTGPGKVPRIPVSSLDTLAEFAAHGIDPERARVLIADTGLPLALGQMLQLLNMGLVTEDDVKVSVAEGNVRNEYMDVALALRRHLLTPHNYAEADLRGVLSPAEAQAGAALSGLQPADYKILFQILGRPLTTHQIVTGEARGGKYGGDYTSVPAGPFRDAIRRSAIRPEYASLAYANRYTLPSAFVIRGLVSSGALSAADAEQLFLESGWPPELAAKVATNLAGGTGGTDKHVERAQSQLWSTAHASYKAGEADQAAVTPALELLGIPAADQQTILELWNAERELVRKQLSPTQLKKAYRENLISQDEATSRLVGMGYSLADAATFLAE